MAKFEKGRANKEIARERITILLAAAKENPAYSRRYIELARELGTSNRISLGKEERSHFCRKCGAYLVPGENLSVRIQHGKVIRTCRECGTISRIPINRKNR